MLAFPNGKINLGLNITEKRPDGYHNLEIVFYLIPIEGALEINLLYEGSRKYCLHQADTEIVGEAEDSLVVKAYKLLDESFDLPPTDTHLLKHVPSGVGLGGGSADAVFMLRLLNEKFNLGLNIESMEDYASRLGADYTFFVRNASTYVGGIGDVFSSVPLSLKGFQLWLVKPNIFVSMWNVSSQIEPHHPERPLKEAIQLSIERQRNCMVDDFEESVFPQPPTIREVEEEVYRQGAIYTSMSGSGSSVYGISKPNASLPDIDLGKEAFIYKGRLIV